MTIKLHDLRPAPGAKTTKTRVGRGEGSKGKTAGRGTKGTKARNQVPVGFEGGQMPLYRRLPKRGFTNIHAKHFNEVNLGRIQIAIDAKKLDAKKAVTVEALVAAGVCSKHLDGVRILGSGDLKTKLSFEVAGVTKSAQAAIEKAGGSVTLINVAVEASA